MGEDYYITKPVGPEELSRKATITILKFKGVKLLSDL